MSALSSMAMDGVKSALERVGTRKGRRMWEGRHGTIRKDLSMHSHTSKAQFAARWQPFRLLHIWLLAAIGCHVMAMPRGAFTWPRPTCGSHCGSWPRF